MNERDWDGEKEKEIGRQHRMDTIKDKTVIAYT